MPLLRPSVALPLTLLVALAGSTRQISTQSSSLPEYGVTDLGTLGGASSSAYAIHPEAFGEVVGSAQIESGAYRAFFSLGGPVQGLGTFGGVNSEAWAVNASIVGRAQTSTGAYHAFMYERWSPRGLVDLGTLGGTQSYATGVNVAGTIVGASLLAGDAVTRAFIYEPQSGVMSPLGATLGGASTVANAISENGDVVGRADLPGGATHRAFLYRNGTTTDLGSLGASSEAYALNSSGIIVGRSEDATGSQRAFRYEAGVMRDLGTLGGGSSEAHAINRAGDIVGWAQLTTGARRAFVWRNGAMSDLNLLIRPDSGWTLEAATGISDSGVIVGYGTHGGQRHAFMLTGPADLAITSLRFHGDIYHDTNIPNPHEAGQEIPLGISIAPAGPLSPYPSTNVTIVDTLSGPAEYVPGSLDSHCRLDGPQQLTCRLPQFEFEAHVFFSMRATGAGTILHSATIASADQPDPNPSNNTASQTNTAISIASLTLNSSIVGGKPALARVTLTSPCNPGGARVTLGSSNPDVASVPAAFDVLPWSGDGIWREFYVTTKPVSTAVTVQISATYGLVTKTVPLTILPAATPQRPYGGTPRAVPGTIQAEDFDDGGEGVAYHDSGSGNAGGAYRASDVDLELTRDTGGGANAGWIAAGEWLEYTIDVAASGTYFLETRVASPASGGAFHVEVNGVNKTGPIGMPNTGGWQSWTTISRSVSLVAGTHVLRMSFDANGSSGAVGNLNYVRLVAASVGVPTPYGGAARSIPGTIQAEDFDEGGEGVAYHDLSPGNSGGQYRATGVDVQRTSDTGAGYNVGWIAPGEWLTYTVSVGTAGAYRLTARVAADGAGGAFHIIVGSTDVTGPLAIPNTGGWQAWRNVTVTVTLQAGVQSMRFVADRAGATGVFGNVNYIALERASTTAPAEVVLYASDFARYGTWALQSDGSAAGGQKVFTPDNGAGNTSAPVANPASYIEASFMAAAGTPYTLWVRLRATGDTKYSESVWVQYSDALANGLSVYPIGSTSGLLVNLENCSGCGVSGWGWQNRAYWLTQATRVVFANSGTHAIRIQMREDGAQLDQVVLSSANYLTSAPGVLKNDSTIVPK